MSNLGNQELGDIILGASASEPTNTAGYGQAQAQIKTTYYAHGQAQAVILTKLVHGQAQAEIVNPTKARVTQSRIEAVLRPTSTLSRITQTRVEAIVRPTTAISRVSQTYVVVIVSAHEYKFAQVQALIDSGTKVSHGQAQGYIKASFAHGQSQGWIEQTYNAHGQSQADIKQTYYGLGQSQADIKQTYAIHGQAQALIVNIYFAHGQAQGTILRTYVVHGQAQAQLGAIYLVHGQAQGTILATYIVHGQSQATIKQTYNAHGQAQADIRSTYVVHGQSQSQIKQTYFGHGQAQGIISNASAFMGHGQARAYILRPVFGQAQANILTYDNSRSGQARAFVIAIRRYMGQAQGTIRRYNLGHGNTQAFILDRTFEGFGQARALIHYSMGFAQAQAYLLTGYLLIDTFTRTTPVADINYPDHGPEYYEYFNGGYTTTYYQYSYVDGTQLVTSGAGDYEWVNAQNAIGAKNATSQIDVKVSQLSDWMTVADLGLRVNKVYGNAVGGYIYYDPSVDRMDVNLYGEITPTSIQIPTISGGEWYTAKFYANDADIKFKFWKRSDPEPGTWLVENTTNWLEVGGSTFYQDAGENPTPTYTYADNYNVFGTIYTPYSVQQSGQARAQIKRTFRIHAQARARIKLAGLNKHGQAQATIQGNTVTGTLIQDTFTRTTSVGVLGTPDIGSYYVTQPEIDFSNVDGQKLVTTGSDYDYVETLADVGATNPTLYIDFMFPQLLDYASAGLQGRIANNLSNRESTFVYYEPSGPYMVLSLTGSNVNYAETTFSTITTNTWYTLKLEFNGLNIRSKVWETNTTEPDWMVSSTVITVAPYGGVGYYQDVGEGTSVSVYLDNFLATAQVSSPPQAYGQAQAYISTTLYRIPGQAQAYILRPILYGQAQASIKRTYRIHGQAQAFINKARGHGQAQATIWLTSRATGNAAARIVKGQPSGQAQARIYAFGQRVYGQANAQIRATVTTRGYGQAQAMIKGPAFGQAAALISGNKYLVRYNSYDLPGYAQHENIDSIMRLKIDGVPYIDGALSEYLGLENKIISLRMKVVGQDYIGVKLQAQKAASMVRSSKRFAKLHIQYWDRYFEVLTKKITIEKSVKESMRTLDYTVEFEAKPWLTGITTYTMSGVGLIDTDLVSRNIYNGGWTPANILVTGTNVTISGYTDMGEYAGFVSISGTVANFEIDSINYTSTDNEVMYNADYMLYVGPGKTYFQINGATDCVITWNDRWYL